MKKLKSFVTVLTLFLIIGQAIMQPISIFAETIGMQEHIEKKDLEEIQESKEDISSELPIIEYEEQDLVTAPALQSESAKANDSPDESELPDLTIIGDSLFLLPSEIEAKELTESELMEPVEGSFNPLYTFEYIRQHARSTSEQEKMLAQSEEYAMMIRNFTRSTGYTLERVRTINEVVVRYLPVSGIHFTHDLFYFYRIRETGDIAFCIEEGVPAGLGTATATNLQQVIANESLRTRLTLIAYFGWYSQNNPSDRQYVATQHMLWEAFGGSNIYTTVTDYSSRKQTIENAISNYNTRPSFHNQKVTLKVGESITLTDTNGVFTNYAMDNLTNTANVTLRKSGNQLTITANANANESGSVSIARTAKNFSGTALTYQVAQAQRVGVLHVEKPISADLSIEVQKEGHARVRKIDENTNQPLAGAIFRFTTSNGQTRELTTNASGLATWSNLPANSVVTIQEISAPNGYVLNTTSQKVTIRANETLTVTFNNTAQLGTIKIDKSGLEMGKEMFNPNYSLAGNVFAIFEGSSVSGPLIDTITTDAQGIAETKALPLGTYTVQEKNASHGFILNRNIWTVTLAYAGQSIAITNTTQKITNQEQKGSVILRKHDIETGTTSQGDTDFSGAIFELKRLSDNKILGQYTTDENGQLSVSNLLLDDYEFVEIEAPEGYLIDNEPIHFSITYAGQTAEVAKTVNVVKENQVIKGGFDLIKIGNYNWLTTAWNWIFGKDNTDQPFVLEGVEFTVYQNFDMNSEVARKQTDKSGYVRFDELPYGEYRVSESRVPFGYKGIADFYVTISENEQSYHYVIENKVKEAQIKFVKVDSETGKEITRSKAGFEIFSQTTGEQLRIKDFNGVEHEVFYTDHQGILQIPTMFAFGEYFAIEVQAPVGYVLADQPVYFEVTGEETDGLVVVKIENHNQKGQLKVKKTVQSAFSTIEKESAFGPYTEVEFAQQAGEGFAFKIRPTEDIITGDQTIRFKAREFIQENGEDKIWKTASDGFFETEAFLYIGSYELIEVAAPKGVILKVEPVPFEILYEGQHIEISSTSAEVENYLQTINIYGYKLQETVVDWKDGTAVIDLEQANNDQVFALKSGEDMLIGETTLPGHTVLGYAIVENGILSFEDFLLPTVEANYYLQEVDAKNLHVIDQEQYFFAYVPSTNNEKHDIHVWADQYAENEEIHLRVARQSMVNELAKAKVRLLKIDELDGQPLENVTFDLIRIDETEDKIIETLVSKHATNHKGYIVVNQLPTGSYKFIESKPLYWYQENQEEFYFEVTPENHGTVIELVVENQRKPLALESLFMTDEEQKQINPSIENRLIDFGWATGLKEGHTYYADIYFELVSTGEQIEKVTKEVIGNGKKNQAFSVKFDLAKDTLKDGDILAARYIFYTDEEKTNEIGRHNDDLSIESQQIIARIPKVAIRTQAHTGDGRTQTFNHGELIEAYDTVMLTHEDVLDGTKRAFEATLVAVTPEGTHQDIWTSERIDYVVSDAEIVKEVMTTVDTGQYPEGTWFYFNEVGFNEIGEEDTAHNFDGSDPDQSLVPKNKKSGNLPQTNERFSVYLLVVGLMFIIGSLFILIKRKKSEING